MAQGHMPPRLSTIIFQLTSEPHTVCNSRLYLAPYSLSFRKTVKSATRGVLSRLESTKRACWWNLRRYLWLPSRPDRGSYFLHILHPMGVTRLGVSVRVPLATPVTWTTLNNKILTTFMNPSARYVKLELHATVTDNIISVVCLE